jgi:hypothetical protein
MSIWATDPSVFDEKTLDTVRCNAHLICLKVNGLRPFTKHKFYIDGIDYSWACRQFGKNLGEDLISDGGGYIKFDVLGEFKYEGNYSFDNATSDQTENAYNQSQQINKSTNFVKTYRFMELKAPDSYAFVNWPMRILVTAGHTNRSESHGH